MSHVCEVFYTTDDDGLHLRCGCGWETAIGYGPTVTEVHDAWQAHVREMFDADKLPPTLKLDWAHSPKTPGMPFPETIEEWRCNAAHAIVRRIQTTEFERDDSFHIYIGGSKLGTAALGAPGYFLNRNDALIAAERQVFDRWRAKRAKKLHEANEIADRLDRYREPYPFVQVIQCDARTTT